jgi:hypothetical protein
MLAAAGGYWLRDRVHAPQAPAALPEEAPFSLEALQRAAPPPSSAKPAVRAAPVARRALATVPLPPIQTPVATVLQDLKQLAASGNAQAACRVAFELDRCHNLSRQQRSAASYRNLADQAGIGPDLARRYAEMAEREQARFAETKRLCEGVPQEETGDAWRYLLQAARSGHGPSMVRYASRRTLWDVDAMRILDGLIAFRSEGPAFLARAAEMGYPEAYEQLAFGHITGTNLGLEIPVDRVKGLAYYIALTRTGTPEEVARIQRSIDYTMRKENLSAEDLARARTLAEPLAAALLQRSAPGSVDFTGGTYGADNGSHCER